jgi:protein-S-isoprenylcysteine O-methyltransferase Ste14
LRVLEHRIPPPLVGALFAALMWRASAWPPALPIPDALRLALVGFLVAAAVTFDLLGFIEFRRSRTTINPLRPQRTTALVTRGIYRVSRNPMYVGIVLLLTAWAIYLSGLWPFLGPALFAGYVTRYQIVPEERLLRERFPEFEAYAARVRRWL